MEPERGEATALSTRRTGAVLLADRDGGPDSPGSWAFARAGTMTLLELCAGALERCDDIEAFVVVVAPGLEDRVAGTLGGSSKFLAAVSGGSTRRRSVMAGVEALPAHFDAVLWHDAARPLASPELFAAVLGALEDADAVVPGVPVGDTLKRIEAGMVRATVPRSGLWAMQTPQGFRRRARLRAAGAEGREADDAWPLGAAGVRVVTLAGEHSNIRVSSAGDLRLVESLLAHRQASEHGR